MKTYRKQQYIKGYGMIDILKNTLSNIPYKKIGHVLTPFAKKSIIALANSASQRVGHNIGEKVGDIVIKPRVDDKKLQEVREQTLKDLELLSDNNSKTTNKNKLLQELKLSNPPLEALYGSGIKKKVKGGMIKILK